MPVSAASTEYYTVELIDRHRAALTQGRHHPVLLVGLSALDLLTVRTAGRVRQVARDEAEPCP